MSRMHIGAGLVVLAAVISGCTGAGSGGYTGSQTLLCSDADDASCFADEGEEISHRTCQGTDNKCRLTEDDDKLCSEVADARCTDTDSCENGELTNRICRGTDKKCCVT